MCINHIFKLLRKLNIYNIIFVAYKKSDGLLYLSHLSYNIYLDNKLIAALKPSIYYILR